MKKKSRRVLMMLCAALTLTLFSSITALASEEIGALTAADGSHITGWIKRDSADGGQTSVELHIYTDGAAEAAKVITVPKECCSEAKDASPEDGRLTFDCGINQAELGNTAYKVEAYLINGDSKTLLSNTLEYNPSRLQKTESSQEEIGPGIPKQEEKPVKEEETIDGYKKGNSLGIFKTTGYCSCKKCSGSTGLTYSGTVPQSNHTISADLSVLPLGTKVIIGETVYTVEDIGGSVDGQVVDLYFSSHQEALNYGVKRLEIFEAVS